MAGSYQRHAAFCYERDSWMCKLCGLPIAKNRVAPHPLAPSLDHIEPQVLGGSGGPVRRRLPPLAHRTLQRTLALS